MLLLEALTLKVQLPIKGLGEGGCSCAPVKCVLTHVISKLKAKLPSGRLRVESSSRSPEV